MTNSADLILNRRLGRFFVSDLSLSARTRPWTKEDEEEVAAVANEFVASQQKPALVYTAFDGDHQELTGLMRRFVLERGCVPVSPDGVLGYKETIEARYNKADVLRDDLSVLRGCNELWVFTDCEPSTEGISGLAEGVLVEIAFFLKRYPKSPVKLVGLTDIILGRQDETRALSTDFTEISSMLRSAGKEAILDLANGGLVGGSRIPPLCYFIIDPLDFKYCRFLRQDGYRLFQDRKTAPVVPNLAIEAHDLGSGVDAIGEVVACWARMMQIAAECYVYPPMEPRPSRSKVAMFLEYVWLRDGRGTPVNAGIWANHNIPKARLLDGWPITQLEKRRLRWGSDE